MKPIRLIGLVALALLAGCDLNLNDPNNPTETSVISSRAGLNQLAVGLQAQFASELVNPIYVTGMITDEIGAGAATFQGYQILDTPTEPLDNNLDPAEGPWAGEFRVVRDANVLLAQVPKAGYGPGTTSGMLAMAELFKAMAFGNLLQVFQQVPLVVGPSHPTPTFATRAEGLDTVVALLQSAAGRLQAQAASPEFLSGVVAPGFDLRNTIYAMLARYALIAGKNDVALQAAQQVDLSVLSEFRFSATDPNPLYNMWYASGNAYQMRPKDSFRLNAQAGDGRVAFWVAPEDLQGATSPLDSLVRYSTPADPIPAYFPDEMRLIQAEVYARNNDVASALPLVNAVRTRCSSALAVPNACLPPLTAADVPTPQAMLDDILYERLYSLYLQGVRWSDYRRFGITPKFTFMNTPRSECDRNPNAPAATCGESMTPNHP